MRPLQVELAMTQYLPAPIRETLTNYHKDIDLVKPLLGEAGQYIRLTLPLNSYILC